MSWMLTSSRPRHWLRLLLGPRPKIPAWINMPPGVWKPLSRTMGRSGRAFSRRTRTSAACDQRPARGELGAVGQGDRHQVVERPARVDQRDLERGRAPAARPRRGGRAAAPGSGRRCAPATAAGPRRPAAPGRPACSGPGRPRTLGTRSPAQRGDPADQVAARARRCRGRRRTCRGTGGPGSRRRRSAAGRRSWPSGCPSAARSGPAAPTRGS